ncbi:hypothetical protein CONPUDRAFT_147355 [Coniophora puteana RWD-64-598 SS2]|uniref:G-patch domain-containing protein n=1 Tax=Coniophora puteana (strain RWD-64-598) TaxID=741705 RepID=A0A5M3M8X5_CONPW|nr:uncharacterized protein CONPUDRAFT_147355 [Coniophora puteana RWD-64-598 SS2]EIW75240.1 hypothetical protein CONPUDRAFT_147355 [Coniophora puteana RWD-64-598 SS2]
MHTSKLKRKLGDAGIDTSSRKANENFCLIGTPLPPLEKSKDTGEFVPLWKQEVRDEKGRRRLHGAFTGGFSAGYFNSVGSKEGWAPSTFVSSRSDRAKGHQARPEDFMDEEDLADIRADQKLVDEHDEMDLAAGTQAELSRRAADAANDKDAITLALENALFPAPQDSAGARILKKMGWRPGHGIGPRLTWRQREFLSGRDPDAPGADADVEEEAKKHLYPRRDTPIIALGRKENSHGLGYSPGATLMQSLAAADGKAAQRESSNIAGGFGLGALNDADEDDFDVYDAAAAHRGSRTAYDASDAHDEERINISGRSSGHGSQSAAPPSTQASTLSTGRFRDGSVVLSGFVIAEKPVSEDKWFPFPKIPSDWAPDPRKVWEANKVTSEKENAAPPAGPPKDVPHAQWKKGMSADERGAALGEIQLPSAPRSVFEYMSQRDQERIKRAAAATTQNAHPSATSSNSIPVSTRISFTSTSAEPGPPEPPRIPPTEAHIAQAALRGFQPFATNPSRNVRYTAYLRAHAELPESSAASAAYASLVPTPGQTPDDFAREMAEYAQAAALFRPVQGAMAGRFTSAAALDLGPKIIEGLHTPQAEAEANASASPDEDEPMKEEEKKEEDPKVHAAKLGMYGPLTRTTRAWMPARLLCKRFGVREPELDPSLVASSSSVAPSAPPPQASSADTDGAANAGAEPETAADNLSGDAGNAGGDVGGDVPKKRDLANVGLGEDDTQARDVLTYERPSMDIFKAIFASDDEDDGDDPDDPPDPDDGPKAAVASNGADPSLGGGKQDTGDESRGEVRRHADDVQGIREHVDLASFKPTFVPRAQKEPKEKGKSSEKSKDRKEQKDKKEKRDKEKKDKKSKKSGPLVSFELDEDGVEGLSIAPKKSSERERDRDRERPRKKKRKEKDGEDGEDMWVEKAPPEIVRGLGAGTQPEPPEAMDVDRQADDPGAVGPARGRKRAVDLW